MTGKSPMNVTFQAISLAFSVGAFPAVLFLAGCDSVEKAGTESVSNAKLSTDDYPAVAAGSLSGEMIGQMVSVTGEVAEQCPSSGCWLTVIAGDGETFVDLNSSPIRLSQNRVGQQVQVSGEVVKRGSELSIKAQQVEFAAARPDSPEGEE